MKKVKNRVRIAAVAIALALVLSGPFAEAVSIGNFTVSDVAELTNAVAQSASYDVTVITVKPGRYDLSTLEEFVSKTSSGAFVWGTNCKVDGSGYAHIAFARKIYFQGSNTKHWSQKTREEESVFCGAGANDTMRLFYGYSGNGRGSTWSHLTFEDGNGGTASNEESAGGAVFVTNPHLMPDIVMTNCVFRRNNGWIGGATYALSVADCLYEDNTALKAGAAYATYVQNVGGSPWTNRVVNCVFRGNSTTGSGGGALFVENNVRVSGCTFINNEAKADGSGGGLRTEDFKTVSVSDCQFINNKAGVQGGGLFVLYGLGRLENCTFVGNSALRGGAFWVDQKVGTIEGCTVVSNTASQNYGAMSVLGFDRIARSTFAFNNTPGSYAGVVVTNFPFGGTIENCLFEENTNAYSRNVGSQVCGAKNVMDCTFRGYGDMIAKNYDRCVFERCAFDFDYWGGGMLLFDTRTGPGHIRNCLFTNNTAHVYIDNATGDEVEIANCTFACNLAKSTWNQGTANTTNSGYLLYAFRGGDNGTGKPRPSTNRVVNCIFANNSWRGGARQDIPSYRTATTVVVPAQNVLCNCLYEQGLDWEMLEVHDSLVGKPRFVLDDQRYPGVPPYMIRRVSPARKAGLVMPWMADETDFAGTAMVSEEGTVDMGAYQCTLPAHGLILTVR